MPKRTLHAAALLAATLLAAACSGGGPRIMPGPLPGQVNVEGAGRQIRGLSQQMQELYGRRDARAIAAMYADEGRLVLPDGRGVTGREAIADLMAGRFRTNERQYRNYRISWAPTSVRVAASGELAVESGRFTESWDGGSRGGPYVIVWERYRDLWRILEDIANDP